MTLYFKYLESLIAGGSESLQGYTYQSSTVDFG